MRFRFTLNNSISGTTILSREPKGWDKTEVLIRRDQKYHGIFREFAVKLEFYWGGGKEYIDEIYNTQGQDALVTITIEIDCNASGNYEVLFNGKLNLKTWRSFGNIGSRDSFTSVDIIEVGPTETVKERLKTKINLSELETLDGTALTSFAYAPYDLNLHSKVIRYSALFENTSEFADQYTRNYTVNQNTVDVAHHYYNAPFSFIYSEFADYLESSAPFYIAEQNFFVADTTDDLFIEYELDIQIIEDVTSLSREYDYAVVIEVGSTEYILSGAGVYTHIGPTTVHPITLNLTLSGNFTATGVSASDGVSCAFVIKNLTIGAGPPATSNASVQATWTAGFVKVSKNSTTAASTAKVFAIHEAGARIAQSITNQTDAFRSEFFGRKNSQPNSYSSNGCGSFGAITNGFQIRQFDIADRPVYLSMEDFYDGLNCIYNLGMGIESGGSGYVIRVEPKEYFYSTNVILRIANIPDIEKSNAESYYFNSLQVGFEKWETENLNGLDEFNTKRHYNSPVSSGNEISAFSKFVASGYAIEFARRKPYTTEPTTDNEYDNLNFIICLNRSVDGSGIPTDLDTAEKDENFAQVLNLISSATSYNIRISPARNALRWNSITGAGLIKRPGTNLKLVYKEGNADMESEFTADTCEGNYNNELFLEGQDIQWDGVNTSNPPIWIPEIYEFDYPLSFTDYKNIKANPTYCLEISRTNTDFIKAYILEIRYKPVSGMATFKLLRANA